MPTPGPVMVPPVMFTTAFPLVAVAARPPPLMMPPVMLTVLVPLVVVALTPVPPRTPRLFEVVTVTLPPPAVEAAIGLRAEIVPECVTEMLALFAALVIWARIPVEPPPALRAPLVLIVKSPLVAAALFVTERAMPPPLVLIPPAPLTVMVPVLLAEAATRMPDVLTPALSVIDVLPVPPTMPVPMTGTTPPGVSIAPFVTMVIPPLPPPVTCALIASVVRNIGPAVILIAPDAVLATMPRFDRATFVPI